MVCLTFPHRSPAWKCHPLANGATAIADPVASVAHTAAVADAEGRTLADVIPHASAASEIAIRRCVPVTHRATKAVFGEQKTGAVMIIYVRELDG